VEEHSVKKEETRPGKEAEKELLAGFLRRLRMEYLNLEEGESQDFIVRLKTGKSNGLSFTLYYDCL